MTQYEMKKFGGVTALLLSLISSGLLVGGAIHCFSDESGVASDEGQRFHAFIGVLVVSILLSGAGAIFGFRTLIKKTSDSKASSII